MEKTILLGLHEQFSRKTTRIFTALTGAIFTVNGTIMLFRDADLLATFLGLSIIIAGIYSLFLAIVAFNRNSTLAPRLEIHENEISYKKRVFGKFERITSEEILKVEFGQYLIRFIMNKQEKVFSYTRNKEVSLEIKESIREWCKEKEIQVVDG